MSISVVVLTYNRVHLLGQCYENVLCRTSPDVTEIIIWDNASTDGTRTYLETLDDPRITVVFHDENIGQNAYREAYRRAHGDYFVDLDDDVIEAPLHWDRRLLEAFVRLPEIGLLSANLENNPHDVTAQIMYGENAALYRVETVNGVRLKRGGPVGGGCAITSRRVYESVGGFKKHRKLAFFHEDAAYNRSIRKRGLDAAYLEDLCVLHAGGPHYSPIVEEKRAFFADQERQRARKDFVKKILLAFPVVPRLNRRFNWFQPPEAYAVDSVESQVRPEHVGAAEDPGSRENGRASLEAGQADSHDTA
jgi:GT2 family glycosyltransferase